MKKMKKKIKKTIEKSPFFATGVGAFFPIKWKTINEIKRKTINAILLMSDIKKTEPKPRSYPTNIIMNLSNICNLSCPMCSINNLREKKITHVKNTISLKHVKAFSEIFQRANHLTFMGLIGESILNPEFNEIIRYLKSYHAISLCVSTNGLGLNEKIQNTMFEIGFDSIIFSIHAATPETYKILQGGNFDKAIDNITQFANEKEKRNLSVPRITIVYALNKANIKETNQMIDLARKLKVDELMLYHFRDYGINTLALDEDPESANQKIDDIYSYAKKRGVISILPKNPPYYKRYISGEDEDTETKCFLPWKGLQMRGSYSHSNSYYLGCCSVFNAFLFNYKKHIDKYGEIDFQQIWHHPVFQYLRETVNSTSKNRRNPLCKYCKSKKRAYLKKTDNAKNYETKLNVLQEFFKGFSEKHKKPKKVEGLDILYTEDKELRALA
jgi:MoaA/NifB/PqqE/SkfB family radical SAM enzyme